MDLSAITTANLESLSQHRQRVAETLTELNYAVEQTKSRRKSHEAAQSAFLREFDRIMREVNGEHLPLFANQSEALEAAEADPVVTTLVTRLLNRGCDVNTLIVAGYTHEERAAVDEWLDAMDEFFDQKIAGTLADGEVEPEPPAFLATQPLTTIELAQFLVRLKAAGHQLTAETVDGWNKATRAEVSHWLSEVERITAEKGEALTADDLPPVPTMVTFGAHAATLDAPEPTVDAVEDSADEPQPENLPAPPRGRKAPRRNARRKLTNGSGADAQHADL